MKDYKKTELKNLYQSCSSVSFLLSTVFASYLKMFSNIAETIQHNDDFK